MARTQDRRAPSAAPAVLLLLLAGTAAAQQLDPICVNVKSPWQSPQRCSSFLDALEAGVGAMTSYVVEEFVSYKGTPAAAPAYAPSVVFATWEGSYVSTGHNPTAKFEPITLNAVIDGVFTCAKGELTPSKVFSFKALGLSQPLQPSANTAGFEAMCQVSPLSQKPFPASAAPARLYAYLWTERDNPTVDNGGLHVGCQDTGAGQKFDGVAAITCTFLARLPNDKDDEAVRGAGEDAAAAAEKLAAMRGGRGAAGPLMGVARQRAAGGLLVPLEGGSAAVVKSFDGPTVNARAERSKALSAAFESAAGRSL